MSCARLPFMRGSTRRVRPGSRATAYVYVRCVHGVGGFRRDAGAGSIPVYDIDRTAWTRHTRAARAGTGGAPHDRRAVAADRADRPYATLHLSTGRSRRTTRGPTRTAHRAWQMRHLTDTIMHRTCTGHACTRNYASMPDTTPDMRLQRARRHALPRDVHCPQYSPHASPGIIPEASRPAMVLGAMRPTRRPIASHPPKTSVTAPRPECATALRCGLGEMAQDFGGEMASRGFGGWARWRPRVKELLLC